MSHAHLPYTDPTHALHSTTDKWRTVLEKMTVYFRRTATTTGSLQKARFVIAEQTESSTTGWYFRSVFFFKNNDGWLVILPGEKKLVKRTENGPRFEEGLLDRKLLLWPVRNGSSHGVSALFHRITDKNKEEEDQPAKISFRRLTPTAQEGIRETLDGDRTDCLTVYAGTNGLRFMTSEPEITALLETIQTSSFPPSANTVAIGNRFSKKILEAFGIPI